MPRTGTCQSVQVLKLLPLHSYEMGRSTEEPYATDTLVASGMGNTKFDGTLWLATDNDEAAAQEVALGRLAVADFWSASWRGGLSVSRFLDFLRYISRGFSVGTASTVEEMGAAWVRRL